MPASTRMMNGYNVLTVLLAFLLYFFPGITIIAFTTEEPFKTFLSAMITAVAALAIKYLVEPLFASLQKRIFKNKDK